MNGTFSGSNGLTKLSTSDSAKVAILPVNVLRFINLCAFFLAVVSQGD